MSFYDFNNIEQLNFELIPAGTIAKVALRIKMGGYDDLEQGWTLGYATKNLVSGAVYLNCAFTILQGKLDEKYIGYKIWQLIGLYSEKNNNRWGAMGRSFIRSILNSAKGFSDKDNCEAAQTARRIDSFADLNGLEFVVRIDVEQDQDGNNRNVIKCAIGLEHKDYAAVMGLSTIPSWG
ncbi:hypothetical protein [Candidatus Tisiphia endosymbiont of Temnostethus pusillus]|uniref:hypothetical protein n=1 Tax=Candidatus Tisiphia endosymbiont of Temnostethus pusillus TaxID=3139335 RepID=UPI0035C8998C